MSDCQFCNKLFTTQGGQVPRNLNCGHTICEDCVARNSSYGKVVCTECRTMTEIKNGVELPLSHSLIKMIDEPQCVSHPDSWKRRRHAEYFCYECNKVICTECSNSSEHHRHTIKTISCVASFYRDRLNTRKEFYEKELNILKSMNERLERLKVELNQTEEEQLNRLRKALYNVLRFEGFQWYPEIEQQLLALVNNYKEDFVKKHEMVTKSLGSYGVVAMAHLKNIEKLNDADLVFEEKEIVRCEIYKIPYDTFGIPNAGLEIFHPVIHGGKLYLKSMKFVGCRESDSFMENNFSDFMKSRPGVFQVGPQQIVVFSHENIFHITFEKVELGPYTRMISRIQQNHGEVHLYKENVIWKYSRVYDPEDMMECVLSANAEKKDIGNDANQAFEQYWNEIVTLGNLVIKHDQIINPIN